MTLIGVVAIAETINSDNFVMILVRHCGLRVNAHLWFGD